MARKKSVGTELSVFKGREARLNHAVFQVLTFHSPRTIYDITKEIKRQKGFRQTKYTNVNRRVKALEQSGYLEKAGSRETQAGAQGILYQLTTRAHIAILLDQVSPDTFIENAEKEALSAELLALKLFSEKMGKRRDQPFS